MYHAVAVAVAVAWRSFARGVFLGDGFAVALQDYAHVAAFVLKGEIFPALVGFKLQKSCVCASAYTSVSWVNPQNKMKRVACSALMC